MATKMAQKQRAVNKQQSLVLLKNMVRISVSSICYMRDLFPSEFFDTIDYGSTKIHQLKSAEIDENSGEVVILNQDAYLLTQWLERGVFGALVEEYLSSMTFTIFTKHPVSGVDLPLESYEFKITYGTDSDATVSINGAPLTTKDQLKSQASKFIRSLVEFTNTLDDIPTDRWITLSLAYTEKAPPDYEPEYFQPGDPKTFQFLVGKPLKVKVGTLKTAHQEMQLKFIGIESLLYDDLCKLPLSTSEYILRILLYILLYDDLCKLPSSTNQNYEMVPNAITPSTNNKSTSFSYMTQHSHSHSHSKAIPPPSRVTSSMYESTTNASTTTTTNSDIITTGVTTMSTLTNKSTHVNELNPSNLLTEYGNNTTNDTKSVSDGKHINHNTTNTTTTSNKNITATTTTNTATTSTMMMAMNEGRNYEVIDPSPLLPFNMSNTAINMTLLSPLDPITITTTTNNNNNSNNNIATVSSMDRYISGHNTNYDHTYIENSMESSPDLWQQQRSHLPHHHHPLSTTSASSSTTSAATTTATTTTIDDRGFPEISSMSINAPITTSTNATSNSSNKSSLTIVKEYMIRANHSSLKQCSKALNMSELQLDSIFNNLISDGSVVKRGRTYYVTDLLTTQFATTTTTNNNTTDNTTTTSNHTNTCNSRGNKNNGNNTKYAAVTKLVCSPLHRHTTTATDSETMEIYMSPTARTTTGTYDRDVLNRPQKVIMKRDYLYNTTTKNNITTTTTTTNDHNTDMTNNDNINDDDDDDDATTDEQPLVLPTNTTTPTTTTPAYSTTKTNANTTTTTTSFNTNRPSIFSPLKLNPLNITHPSHTTTNTNTHHDTKRDRSDYDCFSQESECSVNSGSSHVKRRRTSIIKDPIDLSKNPTNNTTAMNTTNGSTVTTGHESNTYEDDSMRVFPHVHHVQLNDTLHTYEDKPIINNDRNRYTNHRNATNNTTTTTTTAMTTPIFNNKQYQFSQSFTDSWNDDLNDTSITMNIHGNNPLIKSDNNSRNHRTLLSHVVKNNNHNSNTNKFKRLQKPNRKH